MSDMEDMEDERPDGPGDGVPVNELDGYEAGYAAGLERGRRLRACDDDVRAAEAAIDDQSWRFDDPTGQDADSPVMDECYANLIQARDRRLAVEDPERYAEQRYFAQCRMP
jgi:hypothetical protein